jgi:4-hydroxy-tetrahydrodipicolinate reductase
MGATVCAAIVGDPELELAGAVDPTHAGAEVAGVAVHADIDALADAEVEVVVDFTTASAATANLAWCAARGTHAVVGTTGFGPEELAHLHQLFPVGKGVGCVVAPNFALGAVLMMRFAELAAPWFETAEIVELHHDAKVDAPSGTAVLTAARMAEASAQWAPDPTQTEVIAGARGGVGPAGIHVHSVRLRGLVAHQEVLLGTTGQSLTIRHDSYDRTSFMPGVLLAVKWVPAHPGVTVGLENILGL